jgi:uncharacterized protein YdeI (BOF family)
MKTRALPLILAVAVSLLISGSALAHHSMAMYDRSHDTTFRATIVQFDWANPHTQITFTAADEHGKVMTWVAEGPSPHRLADHNWTKDSLKPGDQVTIIGNCNKDGSPTMRFEKVILANGQQLESRRRAF